MLNYIKWELISQIKSKKVFLICLACIYGYVAIVPNSASDILSKFVMMAFLIILYGTIALAFVYGAKKTMDSYTKPTFLLESMIPLSPNKILLAKYILSIIYNVVNAVIFVLGLSIIFGKADINLIQSLFEMFFSDEYGREMLFQLLIILLAMSISYTSITTTIFVGFKSMFPNGKALKFLSYLGACFLFTIINAAIGDVINTSIYLYSLLLLLVSVGGYFITVWLVKNKLEVYN